jgi:hypothetical protein
MGLIDTVAEALDATVEVDNGYEFGVGSIVSDDRRDLAQVVLVAIGKELLDTPPCTQHQSCTCRYALTELGMKLKRIGK